MPTAGCRCCRVGSLLATLHGKTAKDITYGVNASVARFADGAEQSDDITVLALQRK